MLLQFYIVKEMLSTYTKVEETEYNLDDNKNVKKISTYTIKFSITNLNL